MHTTRIHSKFIVVLILLLLQAFSISYLLSHRIDASEEDFFNNSLKSEYLAISPSQSATCGNSVVETGEQCDDGNTLNNDGCSSTCQNEICGDDVQQLGEQCDDGSLNDNVCTPGYESSCSYCDNSCSTVVLNGPSCADGSVDYLYNEQCDDSNLTNGDGCNSNCKYEISNPTIQTYCGGVDINKDSRITLLDFINFAFIYSKQCVDTSYPFGCGAKDSNGDLVLGLIDFINLARGFNKPSCL